jgi:hypothetical protein
LSIPITILMPFIVTKRAANKTPIATIAAITSVKEIAAVKAATPVGAAIADDANNAETVAKADKAIFLRKFILRPRKVKLIRKADHPIFTVFSIEPIYLPMTNDAKTVVKPIENAPVISAVFIGARLCKTAFLYSEPDKTT